MDKSCGPRAAVSGVSTLMVTGTPLVMTLRQRTHGWPRSAVRPFLRIDTLCQRCSANWTAKGGSSRRCYRRSCCPGNSPDMPGPWRSAGQRGGLLGQPAAVLPVVRRTLDGVHPGTLTAQRQLDHWTSTVN